MREPIVSPDADEQTPEPLPSASGSGIGGPPFAVGADIGGNDDDDDDNPPTRSSSDRLGPTNDPRVYNMAVEDLDLSMRAYNCLRRSGIMCVGQILKRSEDELLELRNFGRKSYDELREKLDELGILRLPPQPIEAEPEDDGSWTLPST